MESSKMMEGQKEPITEDSEEELEGNTEGAGEVLAGVKTFEDLLEVVGTRGPWNILLFLLCTYACFMSPMLVMSYQFLGATPDHWCQVPDLRDANWTQQNVLHLAIPFHNDTGQYDPCHMYDYNYTAAAEMGYEAAMNDLPGSTNHTITCPARDFNHTQYQSTVVTEWDLVCERRALYSSTQSALSVGGLVGTLLTGLLFDRYGRRSVLLWLIVADILLANIIIFSPNVLAYITVRGLLSALDAGTYSGGFVIMIETSATRYRSAVGALSVVPWALGYMVTAALAYLIRPWRWLSFAFALPMLLYIAYFWLVPESPRWLLQNGQHTAALLVFKKAASMNGRTLPPDQHLLTAMARITRNEDIKPKENRDVWSHIRSGLSHLVALVVRPELRRRSLILIQWFIGSLVYYGISFSAINLGVNLYLYMFLGGLLEIPSGLVIWPMMEYLGRRRSMVLLYILFGFFIILLAVIMVVIKEGIGHLVMGLSMCGKMTITAVYQLTWAYTAELFPTEYRSVALSQGLFMGSMASMAAPYIIDLLGDVIVWAPSAVFGCSAIVAAALSLVLPETKDTDLLELSPKVDKVDMEMAEGENSTL